MTEFRAIVIGAAAGGGLPQWNCGCENCRLARLGLPDGIMPQTQSSLAVTSDGDSWALLNASPDLRQQLINTPALHPRALRDSPIKTVLLTNGDIDHIAGLLTLREKQPFRLVMTAAIRDILAANPIFNALDPAFVTQEIVALNEPFMLVPGIEARLFSVPGKVPLFMESENPDTALEGEQTVGVELITVRHRIYYIPGCALLRDDLKARISGAEILYFDGTLFTDDEMIKSGTGIKTGQRMGHMSISGNEGSLKALAKVAVRRKIYVHINNTNPVWRDGPERKLVEDNGFEIAFDGKEIAL
ncbi:MULTISPECIES: pyrroloquinoline quinone biosynthesis protein PqqB [Brucella/Ochrobactrum group]|uniref:pyrroloquinoline quinone biosynthesis protein PqqB n=1 Tax=Brucella/Ochrobactrum group TaxID=2826938 RepID=UPI000EF1B0E7|nr:MULTISPECIES: pyrroloquinoline quinone biosynthesis protein PqqB [Brucella]MCI1000632.1 pyrroloquinoline quinone biosynthesis protein PqqB [Ochrobactrum sp. C6C9]RRD24633.1 pyrroloquinoline quinone biosynthesis protein PqqB [Brucellaceae bacterium VT-16-1752]WHT43145.1 pyrroloquinoline quinone biosynthesis protein PqqB [Ochrobactrum sp. SSR]MDX4075189.1 pyrroloquinoline quinone biosynthesis protein PqqB [Brucella sp. NBRC 113783]RLL74105.1 pyrroloquinoline quinone biosynthesis protein PqqB 